MEISSYVIPTNTTPERPSSSLATVSSAPARTATTSNHSNSQSNQTPLTSSRSAGQASNVLSTVLSTGPTSTLATTSVRATAAGSRTVRRNWWSYIIENFRSISRTSKVLLILSLLMVVVQVVVTITILVLSRNQQCDRPLSLFLALYIIRVILACPLNVYLYLNPRENRSRGGQIHAENERRDGWVDRSKSFLDLFATLWFIIGNYLLFTTNTCQRTAPAIFFLSLTWVILGYIIITIPILLCLAVIFCLPCVLVAMRVLHVNEAAGMNGISEDLLEKIPVVKFKSSKPPARSDTMDSTSTSQTIVSIPAPSNATIEPLRPSTSGKGSRFKFSFRKKDKPSSKATLAVPQYYTIENEEDAVCSICLSPYEDGEELRTLWCSHHFHKDCVDEWLRMNRRCPMCREDVEISHQHANNKSTADPSDNNIGNPGTSNSAAGEGSSTGGGSRSSNLDDQQQSQNADDKV